MAADERLELTIPVPGTFRFDVNLSYLSRSTNECMHHVAEGAVAKRIRIGGASALVEVRAAADGGGVAVGVRPDRPLAGGGGAEADPDAAARLLAGVRAYVREWFDLDAELAPFYALAAGDPLLRGAAERFRGLRLIGIPDLYEALCWSILGQQINLTFAYALKRRFVEAFGDLAEWDGRAYPLFPSPETVASLSPSALTPMQISVRKAEYLIDTARLMAEGKLSKAMLREAGDHREALKRLTAVRGIGPWTANYVLMHCLRYREALPIEDAGLHNAIKALLGMDRKPTLAEIRELAEPWAGWESYATFYLWRTLN